MIFFKKAPEPSDRYLSREKLMALPTANKKEGKTRSVGVKPCQPACSSGAKGAAPLPGVFTMIMKQIVMPRKTSSERKRGEGCRMVICLIGSWVKKCQSRT